jgi:ABC-type polysaccharide/polyol phosphate export permease
MFPVSVLPDWLGKIAMLMPLTHSLEAMRRALLTSASITDIRFNLIVLTGFVLFLLPMTFCINKLSMKVAKKNGAFITY